MYDEQEPEEAYREAFSDSYGTTCDDPYNRKYGPKVVSAQAAFQVVGRVLG